MSLSSFNFCSLNFLINTATCKACAPKWHFKPNLNKLSVQRALIATLSGATLSMALLSSAHAADTLGTANNVSTSRLSTATSQDGIVALVNDTPILKSELNAAMTQTRATLQALNEPVPSDAVLRSNVLNSLTLRALQLDLIQRAGIRPNPEAVNQRLIDIARSQGLNTLTELQLSLDSKWPGSYASLRDRIITEASLIALQQRQVASRVNITDQDVNAFLNSPEAKRLEQSEYRTIHIRIPHVDEYSRMTPLQKSQELAVANEVRRILLQTDDAEAVLSQVSNGIAKNYPIEVQGGDMGFHPASGLPTTIADRIINLDLGEVSAPLVTAEGIDVVKLLNKRGADNTAIVPQWHVRHILIKTDSSQSDDLVEQEIYDIYEKLRQDGDFKQLASTYSDDAGTAGRGGDLDWVSTGEMVPEFEAMMMQTAEGDYSTPFKTQFGWHILQVVEQRDRDLSDQYRRNMARELLYQRLAPQARENWLQELKANAYIVIYE